MNSTKKSHWVEVPLGDIFTLSTTQINPADSPNEKFAVYSLPAFDSNHSYEFALGREIDSNKFSITKPCLLVSKLNPRIQRVQVAAPHRYVTCASTEFMVYIPRNNNVNIRYSYFEFCSDSFQRRLKEVATGSTNSHIRVSPKETLEWQVSFPPLEEQRKIAEILTTVDEVIENTEAEISKLEDLRKATMNELLTKGIGHTDFKETEIGRIPKSWEVKTLQELCVLQRGHDLPTQNRVDGNVPIYGSNGIVGFHSTTDIEPNGVVTGRSGSIGDVYFVSGRYWPLNTTLYVVNFRGNDRRFVRMFLQNFRLERFATGTGVPTLNRNDLHPLRIRVPPIREQEDIVSTVGAIEAQLDAMHRSLESKKKMRNALLSDLLTGKVRVKVN